MRNDTDDDFDEQLNPSSGRIEPQFNRSKVDIPLLDSPIAFSAQAAAPRRSNKALGALSALTLAILCSSAVFGWWSMQRMQLLEQQLIATQDSFSKISEDAAGRINDITGKVSATQTSVLSDNEALKMRLNTLENSAVDTQKKQHISLAEYASRLTQLTGQVATLNERSSRLSSALESQQEAATQRDTILSAEQSNLSKQLATQRTELLQLAEKTQTHQQQLVQLDELKTRLKNITTELATLQNNSAASADLTRLQQDILILRSELEQRAAPTPVAAPARNTGPSLADFDAYRAQTNRTISALQEQMRTLQKNTP
ncbi:hypothetical protein [Denitrificimonas caeni]|uniref:hypothetical protein n=1 Tax=Denitrificimonas caeni TaxID=521720 RepID=UPI001964AC3F|nr:hypothetical protein [Denitrificimonas caeni]